MEIALPEYEQMTRGQQEKTFAELASKMCVSNTTDDA